MPDIILLHTNDIHGRMDAFARLTTMIERIRQENPTTPVLYLELGDIEDTSNTLSSLTKGRAPYHLLNVARPDFVAIGNGSLQRYGTDILQGHGEAVNSPQLLANVLMPDGSQIPGTQPTAMLEVDGLRIGFIGLTAPFRTLYGQHLGLTLRDPIETVREYAAKLREDGADHIILLSHMGYDDGYAKPNDVDLANAPGDDVLLILGAHTHTLLEHGEWINGTLLAQTGCFGEYLGRVDISFDGKTVTDIQASVIPITEDIRPSQAVMGVEARLQRETEAALNIVVGTLAQPLDYALDVPCSAGAFVAEMLRERMDAEFGVACVGAAFNGGLPAGDLTRHALWTACNSSNSPGVVEMTGAQLAMMLGRGGDVGIATAPQRPLRGRGPGLMHVSGGERRGELLWKDGAPLDPNRVYKVAGTDFELTYIFGYAERDWALEPDYDMSIILREAIEDYLQPD